MISEFENYFTFSVRRPGEVLLKYDDFKAVWSVLVSDQANENEAFSMNSVNFLPDRKVEKSGVDAVTYIRGRALS